MKKAKEKLIKNAVKNTALTNISIALNINSSLIYHHQSQNLDDRQEFKNGMQIEDPSQQEGVKKRRRKVVFQQKNRIAYSFKNETAPVQEIVASANIDHISKTALTNKITEGKGGLSQINARLGQGIQIATTDRSKASHKSWAQQKNEKKHHHIPLNPAEKSQILENNQFSKQNSSIKAYKYKSDFKSKVSKNSLHLQRGLRPSTHCRNFSTNLEATFYRQMRQKRGKEFSQKRQIGNQQDLKEKILRFRLDILKLLETYQQSEIYKSKASMGRFSPAYYFTNDPQDGANETLKLQQMTNFQRRYESQQNQINLSKQYVTGDDESNQQKTIGTLQLVQYYQTYGIQNRQENSQKHFSLIQLVRPITAKQTMQQQHKNIHKKQPMRADFNLQDFLIYMKNKNIDYSNEELEMLQTYLTSFKKQHLNYSIFFCNSAKKPSIGDFIGEDLEINRQIQRIKAEKRRLARQFDQTDNHWTAIEDWQHKYRLDLISLKKKMWRQYRTMEKTMKLYSKTNRSSTEKPYNLMKCLSEHNLSYQGSQEEDLTFDLSLQIQQISQKDNIDHEQYTLAPRPQHYLPTVLDEELQQNHSQIDDLQILQSISFYHQKPMPMPQQTYNDSRSFEEASKLKSVTRTQKDEIKQLIILQLVQDFCQQIIQKKSYIASKIIYHAKFLKRLKGEKRKGFQTGSNAVKAITQQLSRLFTTNKHIQDSPLSIRQQIMSNLNNPCGPTSKEILSSLRCNPFLNEPVLFENMEEIQQVQVLSVQLFHQFQNNCIKIKELSFERYYDDEEKQHQRVLSLRNFVHIHHKAIFDCFNETFDYQRIFGIWGKPFSWKRKPSFERPIEKSFLPNIMENCKKKVYDNCKFVCGVLLDKENSLIKNYQHQPQLIQQFKEERAHKLLEGYNDEINERWFFTDDDEAEIMLQLAHAIWRSLVGQMVKEMTKISILKHK